MKNFTTIRKTLSLALTLFLTFLCLKAFSNPLPPFIEWQKCFGYTEFYGDEGIKIIASNDGNFILAGKKTHVGVENFWFAKTDKKGNILWELNVFDNDAYTGFRPTDIIQDNNGDLMVVGSVASLDQLNFADYDGKSTVYTSNYHPGNFDFLAMKISTNGKLIWQKLYGGSDEDIPMRIIKNGLNYIILGNTNSTNGDIANSNKNISTWNKDVFLLKIDAIGNIVAKKCIGGSGDDYVIDAIKTNDNHFVLAGNTTSNDMGLGSTIGNKDAFVIKFDENFNVLWQNKFGGTNYDAASSLIQTSANDIIVGISTNSIDNDFVSTQPTVFPNNIDNIWLLKLNNNGVFLQKQIFGGSSKDNVYDLMLNKDKKIILVGSTSSNNGNVTDKSRIPGNNNGSTDVLIMKIDLQFNLIWERTIGGSNDEDGFSIIEDTEGNYTMIGTTKSVDGDVVGNVAGNSDSRDIWLVNLTEPCEQILTLSQNIINENTHLSAKNAIYATNSINTNSTVYYTAGKQINLSSGFEIEPGSVAKFDIVSCKDTLVKPNQNPIQIKINNECREGGMKFVFRPFTPDAVSENFKFSIQNLTPVVPISFSSNILHTYNNQPFNQLNSLFILKVVRDGYDDFVFQGYTSSCEHDGAPLNCPENTHDLVLDKEYYSVGDTVNVHWTGGLLPNQEMQWFTNNVQYISQDNFNYKCKILNFPVKIQAQPGIISQTDRPCHGGVFVFLRKRIL